MSDSISQVLARLRPVIELIFAAHQVPPARAEAILTELIQVLCFKRHTITDPGAWLLAALVRSLDEDEKRAALPPSS